MRAGTPSFLSISIQDPFGIMDIHNKAAEGCYKTPEDCVTDLSRICRLVHGPSQYFIIKVFDSLQDKYTIGYAKREEFAAQLKQIVIGYDKGRSINAWNAFQSYIHLFGVRDCCFNSSNPSVFSIFQGFKYEPSEKLDNRKIEFFLDFVRDVIANEDIRVYEYLLNWMAFIIQNPGKKTETCLVLRGAQGIGKNRFTDTFGELLAGYFESNITEIDHLTGTFNSVIENKMLIVCNEMRNVGTSRLTNFDTLKSIISDSRIYINEKYQPKRTSENVANLIICSNNTFPVKIESGDRRYLVLDVNPKYKGRFDFWTSFEQRKNPEFYSHLMKFLLDRDILMFNSREMPYTEAKFDIEQASSGKFGHWIDLHFNELTGPGIRINKIMSTRPTEGEFAIEEKTFKLQIKMMLRKTMKLIDNDQPKKWVYLLKDEYRSGHRQILSSGRNLEEGETLEQAEIEETFVL